MTIDKLKLSLDDDMSFYEIETIATGDIAITPEIQKKNEEFMKNVFEPQILRTVSICPCRMPEFMERNARRAKLMGIPPERMNPTIEQEDVNQLKYGVVVLSENGVHTGVSAIVQECRKCHKINYWGNADVFSRLVAEVTTNYFSNTEENAYGVTEVAEDGSIFGDPNLIVTPIDEPASDADSDTIQDPEEAAQE